jgi:hypothetical protein
MPPSPKGKPPEQESRDRSAARTSNRTSDGTSAVVTAGMVLLAVVGVATVFSGPLMALVAPPPADHPALPEPARAPGGVPTTLDGGAPSQLGRADGGAHS